MLSLIHRTAATLFYSLGGLTVFAILLVRNGVIPLADLFLRIVDLPLIAAGLLYGSTSLWLNFPEPRARGLGIGIGVGVGALFLLAVYVNFVLPVRV